MALLIVQVQLPLLFFVIFTNCNYQLINAEPIKIPASDVGFFYKIAREEQVGLVTSKLISENLIPNNKSVSPRALANHVVEYILEHEDYADKMSELTRLLLKPLGEYGSEEGEYILHQQKMTIINDWLTYLILGKSWDEWIFNEVRLFKKSNRSKRSLLLHENLKQQFFSQELDGKSPRGKLRPITKSFYKNRILSKDMPTFTLQLKDPKENKRLQKMSLNEPEFGYLHMGSKLLRESLVNPEDIGSIDGIVDHGLLYEFLYSDGKLDFFQLFDIPAKIYEAFNSDIKSPLIKDYDDSLYSKYFDYLQQRNAFLQMSDLFGKWKPRSVIAIEEMKKKNVSESNLETYLVERGLKTSYLDRNNGSTTLADPDYLFEKQNKKISKAFKHLDLLALSYALNTIEENDHRDFIHKGEVHKIYIDIVQSKSFVQDVEDWVSDFVTQSVEDYTTTVPNTIDMLRCFYNGKEHIYALKIDDRTGEYKLIAVDWNKNKLLGLFPHEVRTEDEDFKLDIKSSILLKKASDIIEVLITELSKSHTERYLFYLKKLGYSPNPMAFEGNNVCTEIIPYYECIHEVLNSDPPLDINEDMDDDPAVKYTSCPVNISLPKAEQLDISVEVSANSLRFAARQISVALNFRRAAERLAATGKLYRAQKNQPPRPYISLDNKFMRSMDPGVGFLRLGGVKGAEVLTQIGTYLVGDIKGIYKFMNGLTKFVKDYNGLKSHEDEDGNSSPKEIVLKKFIPDFGRVASIVKIGQIGSKQIFVETDSVTKIRFGRKYTIDDLNDEFELLPVTIRNQRYQLEFVKPVVDTSNAQNWLDSMATPMDSQKRIEVVYRFDTRSPEEIQRVGGFRPRSSLLDYNINMIPKYYEWGGVGDNGYASAFVSTTSNHENALEHAKLYLNEAEEGYIYMIRPHSNFYSVREAYDLAANVSAYNSLRRKMVSTIKLKYGGEDEYAALLGFNFSRVLKYAPVNREDLKIMSSLGYRNIKWIANRDYDTLFDPDLTSENIYTYVHVYDREDAEDMAVNIIQERIWGTKKDIIDFIESRKMNVVKLVQQYNNLTKVQIGKIILE